MSDQQRILGLLRSVGLVAWSTADNRRSHLPKGFPDILFAGPRLKVPGAWETKARGEAISAEQLAFENDWCAGHGLYGRGDYEDCYRFLQKRGLIAK